MSLLPDTDPLSLPLRLLLLSLTHLLVAVDPQPVPPQHCVHLGSELSQTQGAVLLYLLWGLLLLRGSQSPHPPVTNSCQSTFLLIKILYTADY